MKGAGIELSKVIRYSSLTGFSTNQLVVPKWEQRLSRAEIVGV